MTTRGDAGWEPFGIPAEEYGSNRQGPEAGGAAGPRVLNLTFRRPKGDGKDRAATWLRIAMVALGLLAAAAATVSYAAQYQLVRSVKTTAAAAIAALQAGIPDAGALVFAALGIALALHGKRVLRARALNLLCVGISVAMNAIAATPGPRSLAVWVMPAVLYALASDTLIMVVRAHAIARQRELDEALADDQLSPAAVLGGLLLWLLRLVLAPPSTVGGFRRWVIEECPVAPGRTALPAPSVAALPAAPSPGRAATSKPRRRGGGHRRWPGRDWAGLSPAYQARLAGAGITREAYEAGADISAARGHQGGAS
jgi:hypothetical protein